MSTAPLDPAALSLERRPDGAVIVRVPSRTQDNWQVPDAVFAFRHGDPQYRYWDEQMRVRERRDR